MSSMSFQMCKVDGCVDWRVVGGRQGSHKKVRSGLAGKVG